MYTISPYLAEFLGTLIMCTIGCGVIANVELRRSKGHGDNFFTIALGWGFAVTFGVYASHAYSGDHLNPARDFGPRLMHALCCPSTIRALHAGSMRGCRFAARLPAVSWAVRSSSSTTRVRSARGCSSPALWRLRFCSSRGGPIATCTAHPAPRLSPSLRTPTLPRRHARQPTRRPVPCRSCSPKR